MKADIMVLPVVYKNETEQDAARRIFAARAGSMVNASREYLWAMSVMLASWKKSIDEALSVPEPTDEEAVTTAIERKKMDQLSLIRLTFPNPSNEMNQRFRSDPIGGNDHETSDGGSDGPYVPRTECQNGQSWIEYAPSTKQVSIYLDRDALGLVDPGDEAYIKIVHNGSELDTTWDAGPYYAALTPTVAPHFVIRATLP